jgi:hypothetical protein
VTLAELQGLLHGRITGTVADRDEELRAQVVPRPPLEPLERVEIYARMYLHRLVDAVAEDVPHTARLLGHDVFAEAVQNYRAARLSLIDNADVARAWISGLHDFTALDPVPTIAPQTGMHRAVKIPPRGCLWLAAVGRV